MAARIPQKWINKAQNMHTTGSAKDLFSGKNGHVKKQYSNRGETIYNGRMDTKRNLNKAKQHVDDFVGDERIARIKAETLANAESKRGPRIVNNGQSFKSTGQQGLDKIRFHESRGANISDQQRRSALSGDMRRNFSEQGGINRVGVSALRGAVVGGVAGGGIESMQGGDFWDGAKSGAFYGATGMAAARGTRQAVGAQAYRGKDGIMGTMKMNKEAYGVGVKDLMLNQQNVGRAKDVMSSTRKK